MSSYAEIRQRADEIWRAIAEPARPMLRVGVATCGIAWGADKTCETLQRLVAERALELDAGQTGCIGFCFAEPSVTAFLPGGTIVLYGRVLPEQAELFLDAMAAGSYANDWAVGVLKGSLPGIPPIEEHIFWRYQKRRLMAVCGLIDPENADEAVAANAAYEGLARALTLTDQEIIKIVNDSGLWGRGGAVFPTGRKWDFLRVAQRSPKFIICNADEGDPGAFVNRTLMEGDPHEILEGMAIAGVATGAEIGYIYIRDEYPLSVKRVRHAVRQAEERGLLGPNMMDSGKNFEVRVVRGAGSYVCGEETGLISSIQDSRGMPRIKPPFPANAGLWGLPSNVNNVETLANAGWVLRNGAAMYRTLGTERNPGTKMFSVSGDVKRVGVIEAPFGTSLRAILTENYGGWPEGHTLKAIQPGGPLGGIMPAEGLNVMLEPDPFRAFGVLMGGGGYIPFDDTTCIVDMCNYFTWFAEDESCGRCTTCHGGTQRLTEILRRIQNGGGRLGDFDLMHMIADTLRWSNCVHGQAAPTAVANSIKAFRDEFMIHIQERRCPAQICRGLIQYEVVPERATEAGPGAAICPTGAIRQNTAGAYYVEQGLCIRCNACKERSPDAIRVVDAYARPAAPIQEGEPIAVIAAPVRTPQPVGGD